MGGKPFPDGEEPSSSHYGDGTGPAGEGPFAAVVFDEEFVRAAAFHEPSAAERMLAADRARAEADAARARPVGAPADDDLFDDAWGAGGLAGARPGPLDELRALARDLDPDDAYGPYGRYGSTRGPYRGHARWHRPVAWILAVVMGLGVVALAFAAVYRGASSGKVQSPAPPPATTGVDGRQAPLPSVSADSEPPVASAAPPAR